MPAWGNIQKWHILKNTATLTLLLSSVWETIFFWRSYTTVQVFNVRIPILTKKEAFSREAIHVASARRSTWEAASWSPKKMWCNWLIQWIRFSQIVTVSVHGLVVAIKVRSNWWCWVGQSESELNLSDNWGLCGKFLLDRSCQLHCPFQCCILVHLCVSVPCLSTSVMFRYAIWLLPSSKVDLGVLVKVQLVSVHNNADPVNMAVCWRAKFLSVGFSSMFE